MYPVWLQSRDACYSVPRAVESFLAVSLTEVRQHGLGSPARYPHIPMVYDIQSVRVNQRQTTQSRYGTYAHVLIHPRECQFTPEFGSVFLRYLTLAGDRVGPAPSQAAPGPLLRLCNVLLLSSDLFDVTIGFHHFETSSVQYFSRDTSDSPERRTSILRGHGEECSL
jgi:hypothetical protein